MAPRLSSLPPDLLGMRALGAYRPDVYAQLAALADNMLRTTHPDSTLVPTEREMIATYVSSLNNCNYCMTVHGAAAAAHLENGQASLVCEPAESVVNRLCIERDVDEKDGVYADSKLRPLLHIAGQVRESGQSVTSEAVAEAKKRGATDMDIHDTVLIAAMFSMFNRYVDGLTGEVSGNLYQLKEGGKVLAERGYAVG